VRCLRNPNRTEGQSQTRGSWSTLRAGLLEAARLAEASQELLLTLEAGKEYV
jgi:hypothetical protein